MLNRYSSRRNHIFTDFLSERLNHAQSYDRIAGYFSSSILEIAGEAIEKLDGKVRIICNAHLEPDDVKTAQVANQSQKQEWCDFKPEELPPNQIRFKRLFNFLKSGKLEVRVLPDKRFGLAHGKAGVITLSNGEKTSFIGSVNESINGWNNNYELVWEDNSSESVSWVQEEFYALWEDPYAIPLSKIVIEDIERISNRTEFTDIEHWKNDALKKESAASVIIESPLYRKSFGLWDHQKYFVDKAFNLHKTKGGARLILADQVGLGKTCQLAMSALLMSLWDNKPVLILVPKTLQKQWRSELLDLMGIPSAIWIGNHWEDEDEQPYFIPLKHCPRKIGIVSQGLITNNSEKSEEVKDLLLSEDYSCVIVDECHRARRANLSPKYVNKKPQMNRLYTFLYEISKKTHSMIMATATPVQINPVEAWDLLNILSQGANNVLGTPGSEWRKTANIQKGLDLVTGKETIKDPMIAWDWLRNPLPYNEQNPALFSRIRTDFDLNEDDRICNKSWLDLSNWSKQKLQNAFEENYFRSINPYVNNIIRRNRSTLETTINPNTGTPFLQRINVELFGERKEESILLSDYLKTAYSLAEQFCILLKKRCKSAGFFKTLLLRRIGSSMIAGLSTGNGILNDWKLNFNEDNDDDEVLNNDIKNLTYEETIILKQFIQTLDLGLKKNSIADPKYQKIEEILDKGVRRENGQFTEPWKKLGCILFSQYYDTADWIAKNLSYKFTNEIIGLYGGGNSSCYYLNKERIQTDKDKLKAMVKSREIKILVGTDAASEGLNLQTLGTLINIDLPWNPTKLEQRKGRIQRIGQQQEQVFIYNLKYADSVEERVHELLSQRLQSIYDLFGQIPDVLEDVWVSVAEGEIEDAKNQINAIPTTNPFTLKYHVNVSPVNWEACTKVLNQKDIKRQMKQGWKI